jgi:hypothetical protein
LRSRLLIHRPKAIAPMTRLGSYGAVPSTRVEGAGRAFPLMLAFLLAIAFKSNDFLSHPQFWAEDAIVFFKEQLGHGYPLILVPYAGYLHLIPRMVAWVATFFSPVKAPLIYNAAALLISSAALSFVAGRLRGHIPTVLVFLSFMLVPTNGEIFGTLTNVHWFLQFALVIACFTSFRPASPAMTYLRPLTLLLVALTGPFSVFIIGVVIATNAFSLLCDRKGWTLFDGAAAAYWKSRDWRTIAAVMSGAAVQAIVAWSSRGRWSDGRTDHLGAFTDTVNAFIPVHVFGSSVLTGNGWAIFYCVAVVAIAASGRIRGETRMLVLSFVLLALLQTWASVVKMPATIPFDQFYPGDRYFYLAKVVFWWMVWCACAGRRGVGRGEVTTVVAAIILMVAMSNPALLRRPAFSDTAWKSHARELKLPGTHVIPVNPLPWSVTVETDEHGDLR